MKELKKFGNFDKEAPKKNIWTVTEKLWNEPNCDFFWTVTPLMMTVCLVTLTRVLLLENVNNVS